MSSVLVDQGFWRDRRVLLTGHTGFKGAWMAIWLARMGAQVSGVALAPCTSPSLFLLARVAESLVAHHVVDVRDAAALKEAVHRADPEVVFHLAAQPLVRRSYVQPLETFATNVMGTVHLLESMRGLGQLRAAVMVTTDKVYANQEWAWPYRETDPLGGHDPYSASKAASEIAIGAYRGSFLAERGVRVASARAGNVIGGGDWAADRLLPDAVRAWQTGQVLHIRRPSAIRPWQHVLEPLAAYMVLAQRLWMGAAGEDAYNFGPVASEAASVRDVIGLAKAVWGPGANVQWDSTEEGSHETALLSLDCSRARSRLGVVSRWNLEQAVTRTIDWYRKAQMGEETADLCSDDIDAYLGTL